MTDNDRPMPCRPFTDNILFVDAEFTSLDPRDGEILSVAIVAPDGRELYLEVERDEASVSPWVAEHILPLLEGERVSPAQAADRITTFVGDGAPHLVSYVSHFDTVFLHKLFRESVWPFSRYPIDFASMLFTAGLDPANLLENDRILSEALDVELSEHRRMHHAQNDARLLRDAYGKFLRYINR